MARVFQISAVTSDYGPDRPVLNLSHSTARSNRMEESEDGLM